MNQNGLPVVKIIKVGTLIYEASELASMLALQIKSDMGIGGGSTATLIEADRKILVDTSFDYEWVNTPDNNKRNARNLTRALGNLGVKPDDIDIVFITHWHRDHFGNIGIFKKAMHLASKCLVERFGLKDFRGIDDREEITNSIRVILTPGHTIDHASLIIDTVVSGLKARIAIAGDAIVSHSYFQSGKVWKYNADFYSIEAAQNSIKQLVEMSDIIIPGHGAPFMTLRPNELACML